MKKIVYIDMDGVVANFDKAKDQIVEACPKKEESKVLAGFFTNLELIDGSIEALTELSKDFELYFLSTPQWSNPLCWSEKREWVEKHFGQLMFKRLILTHNKGLLRGDFIIDDRVTNGVDLFEGEHIHFGTEKFPTWKEVVKYLKTQIEVFNHTNPSYKAFMETR